MLALMEARIVESELLTEQALEKGRIKPNSTARQIYNSQIFLIRREQGRIEEAVPGGRLANGRLNPYLKATRLLRACETGRRVEAEELLEDLSRDDFQAIPADFLWFGTMAYLSESCALLTDQPRARVLYAKLSPYESRNASVGLWACLGPVAYYLALLAATLTKYDQAERLYEVALQSCASSGAVLWLTRCEIRFAATLLARRGKNDLDRAHKLLERVITRAREHGMIALAAQASALFEQLSSTKSVESVARSIFRRDGDIWELSFEGAAVRVRDLMGLRYIAQLLGQPNNEIHSLNLVAGAGGMKATPDGGISEYFGEQADEQPAESSLRLNGLGDAGELLDLEAKNAYKRRLGELREELEEATELRDLNRAERAREEIEALAKELSRAVGRGGRDRHAGSDQERARLSVSRAIKTAIGQITDKHPALGRYLGDTIRTGLFCVYQPDPRQPMSWNL